MCAHARECVREWTPDTLLSKRDSAFILGILVYNYIRFFSFVFSFLLFLSFLLLIFFSLFFLPSLIIRRSCLGRGSGEDGDPRHGVRRRQFLTLHSHRSSQSLCTGSDESHSNGS